MKYLEIMENGKILHSDFFFKNFYNNFNQNCLDIKYFYGFMYSKIFYNKDLKKLFLKYENNNKLIYKINSLIKSKNYKPKKIIQKLILIYSYHGSFFILPTDYQC